MNEIRFMTPEDWGQAVEHHKGQLLPPWVHLDRYWHMEQDGSTAVLFVTGAAIVAGHWWTFRERVANVLTGDNDRVQQALQRSTAILDGLRSALAQDGIGLELGHLMIHKE